MLSPVKNRDEKTPGRTLLEVGPVNQSVFYALPGFGVGDKGRRF
jgi:hypothetical protein